MYYFNLFLDFFLHLDKNLQQVILTYGTATYLLLFIIIFMETGFVVTPFLPGDSLLFVAGALASQGIINAGFLFIILTLAAIMGDTVNYWIGSMVGKKVFHEKSRFFKKEYLMKTEKFYEKYGGKTIILARFMPIIRTFAPFVAGVGKMSYGQFFSYNVIGGILWVFIATLAGYFFGNIKFVRENFSLVIIGVVLISLIPIVVEILRKKIKRNK